MVAKNEVFLKALADSATDEYVAGSHLAAMGFNVSIIPKVARPDVKDRGRYSDKGDLVVHMRLEVKHFNVDFTSKDDFPFDPVIVTDVYKHDRHPPFQWWGYIILNRARTHFLFITRTTRKYWIKKMKYSEDDKMGREIYYCPLSQCMSGTIGEMSFH